MTTTREQIGTWFDQGVAIKMAYMIVWCDTYDHSDYPQFTSQQVTAQWAIDNPQPMQKAMEVYDLKADKDEQLDRPRCWALVPT